MTPRRRRGLALGAALVAVYVMAVALSASGGWPARLLFDGVGPPSPYRWVSPPPDRASTNQAPQAARQTVNLSPDGSIGLSVATPDAQASLVAQQGAFPAAAGQSTVVVTITPLDPATLGSPPSGLTYQGNAYRFEAAYQPSGDPVAVVKPVSVLLQYPVHATVVARRDGSEWTALTSTSVAASLEVFADTTRLGVFVAAGPNPGSKPNLLPYISGGLILLAVVAGLIARRRESRRRDAEARVAAERAAERARRRVPGTKRRRGKRR